MEERRSRTQGQAPLAGATLNLTTEGPTGFMARFTEAALDSGQNRPSFAPLRGAQPAGGRIKTNDCRQRGRSIKEEAQSGQTMEQ